MFFCYYGTFCFRIQKKKPKNKKQLNKIQDTRDIGGWKITKLPVNSCVGIRDSAPQNLTRSVAQMHKVWATEGDGSHFIGGNLWYSCHHRSMVKWLA